MTSAALSQLSQLVDALDSAGGVIAAGDDIVEAFRLADRLTAMATAASGLYDRSGQWELDGATSMVAWLRHRTGMTGAQARQTTGNGRLVTACRRTADAWAAGRLSGGQVAAIRANVTGDASLDLFADHEAELLQHLERLTTADTATAMRAWRSRAGAVLDPPDPGPPPRSLHLSATLDGRRVLTGDLDPQSGELLETALRLAESPDVDGEPARGPSHRRADALADVCRYFLDHQTNRTGGRHRPHVEVVVPVEELNRSEPGPPASWLRAAPRTPDGTVLDPAHTASVVCDAALHRLVMSASTILDYGRATRSVPAGLFATLVVRDRHCRFPGCDRRPGWCEAHHVVPWEAGGTTEPANLVLLCSRHHHLAHRPRWRLKLLPDATVEVTTPGDRVLISHPPDTG